MKWGCIIKNVIIEKGDFRFEAKGLKLHGSFRKIPIIGKTGSGKSSFLKSIFGLEPIVKGEIVWTFPNGKKRVIDSNKISDIDKIRSRYFGFAFQNSTLTEYLTVEENLLYPLLLINYSKVDALKKIKEEIVDYLIKGENPKNILSQFPHELSGGQKQRISLFQAMIHNPFIILADEPTGSLDEDTRKQIMDILYKWADNQEKNRLLIWITHHQDDIQNSKASIVLEIKNNSSELKDMRG